MLLNFLYNFARLSCRRLNGLIMSEMRYLSFQVRVFYAVRIFLGLLSVITEATLVVALSRKYGKRLASYALAMLCLTSGCFFASTSE